MGNIPKGLISADELNSKKYKEENYSWMPEYKEQQKPVILPPTLKKSPLGARDILNMVHGNDSVKIPESSKLDVSPKGVLNTIHEAKRVPDMLETIHKQTGADKVPHVKVEDNTDYKELSLGGTLVNALGSGLSKLGGSALKTLELSGRAQTEDQLKMYEAQLKNAPESLKPIYQEKIDKLKKSLDYGDLEAERIKLQNQIDSGDNKPYNKDRINHINKVLAGYDKELGPDYGKKLKEYTDYASDYYDKNLENTSEGKKAIGGIVSSLPQMATGFIDPAVFFATSYGSYADQAAKEGASPNQQGTYGFVGGMTETATEALPFEMLKKTAAGKWVNNGAKSLAGKYGKQALATLAGTAVEATQEAITSPIMQAAKKGTYDSSVPLFDELDSEGNVVKQGIFSKSSFKDDVIGGGGLYLLLAGLGVGVHKVGTKLDPKGTAAKDANKLATDIMEGYADATPENLNTLDTLLKKVDPSFTVDDLKLNKDTETQNAPVEQPQVEPQPVQQPQDNIHPLYKALNIEPPVAKATIENVGQFDVAGETGDAIVIVGADGTEHTIRKSIFDVVGQVEPVEAAPMEQQQNIPGINSQVAGNTNQLNTNTSNSLQNDLGEVLNSEVQTDAKPQIKAPELKNVVPKVQIYKHREASSTSKDSALPYIEQRTMENVGNKEVKSYQYLHPQIKEHVQQEANIILGEVEAAIKGEKESYVDESGERKWTGTKKLVSQTVQLIQDETGMKYDEIKNALKRIIEDHGRENTKNAKKIELIIDHRLSEGYTDFNYGDDIPPNEEYLRKKANIEKGKATFENIPTFIGHSEPTQPSKINYKKTEAKKEAKAPEVKKAEKEVAASTQAKEDVKISEKEKQKAEQLTKEATAGLKEIRGKVRSARGKDFYVTKLKGLAFDRRLIQDGKLSLVGQTVSTPEDVAMLAQIYRDPRFETLRYIYTKGNTIVHMEGVTSRVPAAANVTWFDNVNDHINYMKDTMEGLGADGFYLLHNHPSGVPKASDADIRATLKLASSVKGFRGHVIINSNKYGHIAKNGYATVNSLKLDKKEETALTKKYMDKYNVKTDEELWKVINDDDAMDLLSYVYEDKLLTPEIKNEHLNKELMTPSAVASITKNLQLDRKTATIIYVDAKLKVRALEEVPMKVFGSYKRAKKFLEPKYRAYGTGRSIIVTGDNPLFNNTLEELIKNDIALDVIYNGAESWRDKGINPVTKQENTFFDKEIKGEKVQEEKEQYSIENLPKIKNFFSKFKLRQEQRLNALNVIQKHKDNINGIYLHNDGGSSLNIQLAKPYLNKEGKAVTSYYVDYNGAIREHFDKNRDYKEDFDWYKLNYVSSKVAENSKETQIKPPSFAPKLVKKQQEEVVKVEPKISVEIKDSYNIPNINKIKNFFSRNKVYQEQRPIALSIIDKHKDNIYGIYESQGHLVVALEKPVMENGKEVYSYWIDPKYKNFEVRASEDTDRDLEYRDFTKLNYNSKAEREKAKAKFEVVKEAAAEYKITDRPNFKKWFDGSKVTDEQGEPLKVFHGSASAFDTFDSKILGKTTNAKTAQLGFFFTDSAKTAGVFAKKHERDGFFAYTKPDGGNIMSVYLSIKNPLVFKKQMFGDTFSDFKQYLLETANKTNTKYQAKSVDDIYIDGVVKHLKAEGYDGIIIENTRMDSPDKTPSNFYIAFSPTQIKSATGNNGNFDSNKPSIVEEASLEYDSGHEEDRQFIVNSMLNSDAIPEEVKDILRSKPELYKYIQHSNVKAEEKARTMVANGFDKMVARIKGLDALRNDLDTAIAIEIEKQYIEQGEFEKAAQWSLRVAKLGTESGRAIQYFSMLKRYTAEWTLNHVQREMEKSISKVKKKILDEKSSEIAGELEGLNDGTIDNVIEQIKKKARTKEILDETANNNPQQQEENSPEEKLANRVENHVKPPKEKVDNALNDMVKTLFDVAKEVLPEKERPTPKTAMDFITKAMLDKEQYKEVWEKAQEIVKSRFKEQPELLSVLDNYFEKYLTKPFSEKQMQRAVKQGLKANDMDLDKLVRKHYTEVDAAGKTLAEKMIAQGMPEALAKELEGYIIEEFKKQTAAKKKSILERIFKERAIGKNKELYEKIIELSNLGAFDSESFRELVAKKYKIKEVLTKEASAKIIEMSNEIQELKEGRDKNKAIARLIEYMEEQIGVGFLRKLNTYQTINMLANTTTAIRNISSNFIFSLVDSVRNDLNAGLDFATSWGKAKRTATVVSPTHFISGAYEGWKEAWADWKENINTKNVGSNKRMESSTELRSGRTFKNTKPWYKAPVTYGLAQAERLMRLLLDDRIFENAHFKAEMARQRKLARLNKVEFNEQDAIEKAAKLAEKNTFNDTNIFSKNVVAIKRSMNLGKAWGAGDVFLKFSKVPANLIVRQIEYSPVIFLRQLAIASYEGFWFKTFNKEAFLNSLSKAITGSAIVGLGIFLYKLGVMTLDRDKDKDAQAFNEQTGYGKFKLNLSAIWRAMTGNEVKGHEGDMIISYDWATPFGQWLAVGGTMSQSNDESKAKAAALNYVESLNSGLEATFNQPMLQGVKSLFSGDSITEGILTAVAGTANTFVPMSSTLNQVKKVTDNKVRETYDPRKEPIFGIKYAEIGNKMAARLPILSKRLPEKVDTLGRTKDVNTDFSSNYYINMAGRIFNSFFNPAMVTKAQMTDEEKVIEKIVKKSGSKTVFPRTVDKTIDFGADYGGKIDLTPSEYVAYQKFMGANTAKIIREKYMYILDNDSLTQDDYEKIVKDIQNDITDLNTIAKKTFSYYRGLKYHLPKPRK